MECLELINPKVVSPGELLGGTSLRSWKKQKVCIPVLSSSGVPHKGDILVQSIGHGLWYVIFVEEVDWQTTTSLEGSVSWGVTGELLVCVGLI